MPTTPDYSSLVEIKDVRVNSNLPQKERIAEYVRQIKNPYQFKHGKHVVHLRFNENGPTLEECLLRVVSL